MRKVDLKPAGIWVDPYTGHTVRNTKQYHPCPGARVAQRKPYPSQRKHASER